jgi:hypothetical protein
MMPPRRIASVRGASAVLLLVSLAPCCVTPLRADPAPVIHYAPGENLERVDVALIDRAEHEIDMAAYVLTDWAVMQALTRAVDRGVAIRINFFATFCQLIGQELRRRCRLRLQIG